MRITKGRGRPPQQEVPDWEDRDGGRAERPCVPPRATDRNGAQTPPLPVASRSVYALTCHGCRNAELVFTTATARDIWAEMHASAWDHRVCSYDLPVASSDLDFDAPARVVADLEGPPDHPQVRL